MDELQKFKEMSPEEANAYLEELNDCSHDCSTCGSDCAVREENRPQKPAGRTIAITGGKGGTGKSTVTVLLAAALARQGLKVGILDADVYGASVPHILGLTETITNREDQFVPVKSRGGISVVSMASMMADLTEPIIYPGLDTARIAVFFWTGTDWGDLDVLLVDMPSGAGDTALEYFTTLPLDKSIAVVTPGELTAVPARRAIGLSRMLMLPVMGIIENMAPDENEARVAGLYGDLPLLAAVPDDPEIRRAADGGRLEELEVPHLDFLAIAIGEELEQERADANG